MSEKEVVYTEIETGVDCICSECKEHTEEIIWLEDGEEVERVSNCCSATIYAY